MYKYCKILIVITVITIFYSLLVNARHSLYHTSYENIKETSPLFHARVIEPLKVNDKPRRSIRKRDTFDNLLDLDEENDMDLYRDVLVSSELNGADKSLLDHKLEEAENMNWTRKSAFHRYAMQLYDDIKRHHEIRTNITDYNV